MPLPPPNAFANIMSMSHLSSCATHESRRFADQPSHDEYCNQAFSRFRIRRWHFEVFQKVTCFGMTHFEKPSLQPWRLGKAHSKNKAPNWTPDFFLQDHEFIPTRQKTITASRPAADPGKFTKVPSNPLLISAQKQIMQAEEIRRRKESARETAERAAAAAAAAADGPAGQKEDFDWQSNLSSWKNRRRKQSEEALQRVAEVKALEDAENSGEPRKMWETDAAQPFSRT